VQKVVAAAARDKPGREPTMRTERRSETAAPRERTRRVSEPVAFQNEAAAARERTARDGSRTVGTKTMPRDDDPTPAPKTFVGRTFGRYRLSQFVGAGKTWAVFLAYRDDDIAPRFVVRLLTSKKVPDSFKQALRDRLEVLARLQHPTIVRPVDWNDKGKTTYVVQRYCPGLTLQQVMSHGRCPWPRTARIIGSLLEAMRDYYGMGVPYLQLALDSIIVAEDDTVQLVHLGVHRELPESATGRRDRPRAEGDRLDQYLVGQVAWFMLTGQRLFGGREVFFDGLLPTDPPLVSTETPDVPVPLARILARLLKRDPAQRFVSLSEALHEWNSVAAAHLTA
jgi:serine/threonine protein kinase